MFDSHFANFLTDSSKKFSEAKAEHEKAVELGANDTVVLSNYAVFCAYTLTDEKSAESLFKRAATLDVREEDDDLHYKYALFLARRGGGYDAIVRRHFKVAIFKGPNNCLAVGNYIWWLLSRGSWMEASRFVDRALGDIPKHMQQLSCELRLYKALVMRLQEQDDSLYLAQIKDILDCPFPKVFWPLRRVLQSAAHLDKEDVQRYSAISDAITDDSKHANLAAFARWNKLTVIEPDATA